MASGNPFLQTEGMGGLNMTPFGSAPVNPFMDAGDVPVTQANNPFGAFMVDSETESDGALPVSNPFADMGTAAVKSTTGTAFGGTQETWSMAPGASVLDSTPMFQQQLLQPTALTSTEPPSSTSVSPVPVSDETLHLIASVTGHMEATSKTLVGQLNQVKTPRHSPTHQSKSPSPTLGEDPAHDAAFSVVFAQTVEEEYSDQEHEDTSNHSVRNTVPEIPPTPSDHNSAHPVQVDLWDTPVASQPKTTDQILSLFNKTAGQNQEVDLLSGSLLDEHTDNKSPPTLITSLPENVIQPIPIVPPSHIPLMNVQVDKPTTDGQETTEDQSEEDAACLAPPPPPPRISSPSEEIPLRPLDLQPIMVIEHPDKSTDSPSSDTVHTAAAFMDAFAPVMHQSVITPPTPISPIEPSPMPSIAPTPTVVESKPIVAEREGEMFPPGVQTTTFEVSEPVEKPVRPPPPPPRAPVPPPRPALPSVPTPGAPVSTAVPVSSPFATQPLQQPSAPINFGQPADVLDIFSAPVRVPPPAPPRTISALPVSPNPFADMLASVDPTATQTTRSAASDPFDAFSKRFEKASDKESGSVVAEAFDPFAGVSAAGSTSSGSAWGAATSSAPDAGSAGFGDSSTFDSFLSMTAPPVPHSTPARGASRQLSGEDGSDFSVFIRPQQDIGSGSAVPALAPPPRTQVSAFQDLVVEDYSRSANPFLSSTDGLQLDLKPLSAAVTPDVHDEAAGSLPDTPLYDEDISQPLESFPRTTWQAAEFHMYLRQPNKKKITGQRFWKKIFIRLADNAVLQLYHDEKDSDPFQELPLQACYSVSDIGTQQFDQYGKQFTMKLQYIFYKERPGMRPGQITKAEKITKKLGQFAMSAWEGDYDRVKEFASDVRKLGMPVEHAPQISQLLKLGTQSFEDLKLLSSYIEETLFKVTVTRDRALSYKTEEVQITGVDEVYIELDVSGSIIKQIARVRLFFLAFLSGMPDVELGMNDLRRQGKEVVGRHDIIPVATEEWIRLEDITFHNVIERSAFDETQILKFKPPDGCYIELMRYRIRPPRGRELPLQVKIKYTILKQKVEISGDILVPGYISRKMGQIPCEDVSVRIPLPDCWVYMFRVEKHFRYGSVKAAHRRQGKVKGLERFLGAVDTLEQSMMEVSSGTAKYERQHKAIVWRIPRLPKEGQGAYTNHTFSCKMSLTSFDQMPESIDKYFMVEYTMPHTTVSHTVCRSVSLSGGSGDPPEKYVRYLARYEYKQEMEFCYTEEEPQAYTAVTRLTETRPVASSETTPPAPVSSGSDSDSE